MTRKLILGLLLVMLAVPVTATNHLNAASPPVNPAAESPLIDGEVRRVDKDAKKLSIRHGPITNLDMPAMTMVFQVKDPAMLDQVKAGDKVRFVVEKSGGAYTVTHLEAVK